MQISYQNLVLLLHTDCQKDVQLALTKRMDKMSTKIQQVEQKLDSQSPSELPKMLMGNDVEAKINEVSTYIEKVDHKLASLKDSVSTCLNILHSR